MADELFYFGQIAIKATKSGTGSDNMRKVRSSILIRNKEYGQSDEGEEEVTKSGLQVS